MCLRWELNLGWRFVSHEAVFSRNDETQGLLWKFSLFESDEALLETIALRRLTLDRASGFTFRASVIGAALAFF